MKIKYAADADLSSMLDKAAYDKHLEEPESPSHFFCTRREVKGDRLKATKR